MTVPPIYNEVCQLLDLLTASKAARPRDLTMCTQSISVKPRSETQKSITPRLVFTLLQLITELYTAFIQISKDMPSFLLERE